MGFVKDTLFGKEAKASGPVQSQRFQQGQDLLENAIFGNFQQQQAFNQGLGGQTNRTLGSGGRIGGLPTMATKGQIQFPGGFGSAQERFDQTGLLPGQGQQGQQSQPQSFSGTPLGFQQAGQRIAGQLGPQTTISPLQRSNTTDFRFQQPNTRFNQRRAFQFQDPRDISIPDVFTPQFNLAQGRLQQQFDQTEEERLADLNRRGLLTTGAATRSQDLARQERDRRLTDLASQFSIAQGQAALAEEQQQRGLDQQREFNQAAEIFRQQGASDQQAQFLANQALQTQSLQQAANLATQGQRFQQGLQGQQLRGQQQAQRFGQQVQGRQLGLQEEQLAQLVRRQPLEDLTRLQLAQFGQQGGTAAQPGIIPTVLGEAAGAAASAFI